MNRTTLKALLLLALLLVAAPDRAAGYVGPGVGLAAIGAALAVVGGIFLGVAGFVWYPFKRAARFLARLFRSGSGPTES